MLISLKHRFVFLSNMKAASTTIETSLAPFAELQRLYPRNSKHFSLAQMAQAFPAILQNPDVRSRLVVFGVVREPRDWIVSWFNYRSRAQIADPTHHQHDQYCGDMDFEHFARAVTSPAPPPYAWVEPQHHFLGHNGQCACDYVIDFDHFDRDFAQLCDLLGLGTAADVLKVRNVTESRRISADQIDWQALPELTEFLAPDTALRQACLSRQTDQVAHLRQILAKPGFEESARWDLLGTAQRSVIASALHGPTKGVSEAEMQSQIEGLDQARYFQEIVHDWME